MPPGTRVRARVTTVFAPLGAPGVVLGSWMNISHAYTIRFDEHPYSWLMWEDELECIEMEVVAVALGAP
jgi:hypothetical protein